MIGIEGPYIDGVTVGSKKRALQIQREKPLPKVEERALDSLTAHFTISISRCFNT